MLRDLFNNVAAFLRVTIQVAGQDYVLVGAEAMTNLVQSCVKQLRDGRLDPMSTKPIVTYRWLVSPEMEVDVREVLQAAQQAAGAAAKAAASKSKPKAKPKRSNADDEAHKAAHDMFN